MITGISYGLHVKQFKTFECVFVILFDSKTNVIFFFYPIISLKQYSTSNFEIPLISITS